MTALRYTCGAPLGRAVFLLVCVLLVLAGSVSIAADKGTVRVAAKADMTTLDPATATDYQSWMMVEQIFDSFYNFDKDGRLYPDLAESLPKISPDGLTYTITLRKGVLFHHGREVDTEDVKFTFERTLSPGTKSYGQRFLNFIDGAKEMLEGKATELRGLKLVDRYTFRLQLTQPVSVFVYNLTISPVAVLPREVVRDKGANFGNEPVGTGPFRFVEWVRGQRFVMERNQKYHKPGMPRINRIEYLVGVDPAVAVLRFERGEVDFLADGIPGSDLARVVADPKLRERVVSGTVHIPNALDMNVTMKPFDDVRVRRAVAHAIDKDRMVRLMRGRAVRSDSFLTPGTLGYNPNHPRVPHNPAEAKALLSAAGYPNGFKTELYFRSDNERHKIAAETIPQDLKAIGVDVELRPLTTAAFYAAVGKPGTVPMGIISKGLLLPHPFDPLTTLSCASAQPGTRYPSYYCNTKFDELLRRAESLTDQAAGIAVYQQAEELILADLPRIFLFNSMEQTMHTPRLKSFYIHPTALWRWRDYSLEE